jgi:hypothetical protein
MPSLLDTPGNRHLPHDANRNLTHNFVNLVEVEGRGSLGTISNMVSEHVIIFSSFFAVASDSGT